MRFTFEAGQNEELRKEILDIIRSEIRKTTGQTIKEMVEEHMKTTDVAARVVASFKELVDRQLKLFASGYGSKAAGDIIAVKFREIVDKQFEEFFQARCIKFLSEYMDAHIEILTNSMSSFLKILDKLPHSLKTVREIKSGL